MYERFILLDWGWVINNLTYKMKFKYILFNKILFYIKKFNYIF